MNEGIQATSHRMSSNVAVSSRYSKDTSVSQVELCIGIKKPRSAEIQPTVHEEKGM